MQIPHKKSSASPPPPPDPLMTTVKLNELKNRLERLKNFNKPKLMAEVSQLSQLGDFSENAEYQLAKGRLRGTNNAILKLEAEINNAIVISPNKKTDTVQIGCEVTVACGGQEKTYQILGSAETDPARGIISHHSPIGSALMGHQIGEIVKIKLADKEVEYKIIKIS